MKLPDQTDQVTKDHALIRLMLATLRARMEVNSFELRGVEAMIKEAASKGPLDRMQMSMNGAALMARTSRDSLDAGLMLIGKLEAGLDENAKQRQEIDALKKQCADWERKYDESFAPSMN